MNTHSSIYGSTKSKTGSKFQKTHIFSIVYTGYNYKLHQPVAPKKRRAEAHPALGNCDRMHEQTDFSTFSAKKAQKGDFYQKTQ